MKSATDNLMFCLLLAILLTAVMVSLSDCRVRCETSPSPAPQHDAPESQAAGAVALDLTTQVDAPPQAVVVDQQRRLLDAIRQVESGGDDYAVGDGAEPPSLSVWGVGLDRRWRQARGLASAGV